LLDLAIDLHVRNNILNIINILQSLTHYQFSLFRFQNLFKFASFKNGYIQDRQDTEFQIPIEFCFKSEKKVKCDIYGATVIYLFMVQKVVLYYTLFS